MLHVMKLNCCPFVLVSWQSSPQHGLDPVWDKQHQLETFRHLMHCLDHRRTLAMLIIILALEARKQRKEQLWGKNTIKCHKMSFNASGKLFHIVPWSCIASWVSCHDLSPLRPRRRWEFPVCRWGWSQWGHTAAVAKHLTGVGVPWQWGLLMGVNGNNHGDNPQKLGYNTYDYGSIFYIHL